MKKRGPLFDCHDSWFRSTPFLCQDRKQIQTKTRLNSRKTQQDNFAAGLLFFDNEFMHVCHDSRIPSFMKTSLFMRILRFTHSLQGLFVKDVYKALKMSQEKEVYDERKEGLV